MRQAWLSLLLVCLAVAIAPPAWGQTTTPTSGLEVHEWAIFISDPYQPQANSVSMVGTTLPDFIETRRTRASGAQRNDPSPIGLIRIRGAFDGKFDVKLDIRSGRFLATWPPARPRTGSVLWRDLTASGEAQRLMSIEPSHWLNLLRGGNSLYLAAPDRSERFLLYDCEVGYTLPLKMTGGKPDGLVQFANSGTVPLREVVAYRPEGNQWRSVALGDLLPSSGSTTKPSTAPTTSESPQFVDAAPKSAAELLADWQQRLDRWDLDDTDFALIARTLQSHALDSRRVTAVYRLDDAEMERLLPLEIVPQPKSIKRLGLVIVKNADPSVQTEIDALVLQLGDNDWRKREQASDALARLGPAARAKLQSALSNRDPEIAMRAERLLAAMPK